MSTAEHTIPADLLADMQAVANAVESGTQREPELTRRIRERADKVRERLRQEHGVLDIGVPAICELRGELPK